jgi:arylsulfatase A-like enzyme
MNIPGSGHAGYIEDMPISSIDIMPTIVSLAGLEMAAAMDGIPLNDFIGNDRDPKRPLFWHYPHYSNQGGNPGSVIRMGRYKLIHDFEKGSKELYDLEEDIGEEHDISAQMPTIADSLYQLLDNWREVNNVKMMVQPNPEWDRSEPIVE